MSNYTKITDFDIKDDYLTGNPLKIVKGAEIDAEFVAIAAAITTKANSIDVYTKAEADAAVEAELSVMDIVSGYAAGTAPGNVVTVAAGFTLSTGLAAGTIFMVYNNSGSAITITQDTGLTLRLAGTNLTGNRTAAARSLFSIVVISTSEYLVVGAGVS